jgi:hypothetical protein
VGYGIAVDSSGAVYITGSTASESGFPIAHALQSALGGEVDAFIAKLNPTGTGIEYST